MTPCVAKLTRDDLLALDVEDPLAPVRKRFCLPKGVIYLDGNSLGALPRTVIERTREVVEHQWGNGLIRSWTAHGWIDLPRTVGDKIARLVGARAGEVIVTDSTTVNIFRLACAALRARPDRRGVLLESDNFPADNYIAEGIRDWLDNVDLRFASAAKLANAIDDSVALVLASHVNYRTGRIQDLPGITAQAHDAGALVLWDLAHSAGIMPVDVDTNDVDLAVGCGYKYLCGGPGAPGFLFVAERLQEELLPPLYGWLGHAEPFAFEPKWRPAPGISRHQCGTPGVLGMTALDAALDVLLEVDLAAVRRKSVALSDAFVTLVEQECDGHGLALDSPRDASERGNQIVLRHSEGYAICQALIARNVIGDFRAPEHLRFGFSPLYLWHVDMWDAVAALRDVMEAREWDHPAFQRRAYVT
jgi:kynureninase